MQGGLAPQSGNSNYPGQPFFFVMLPFIEQDNIPKTLSAYNFYYSWGHGSGCPINGYQVVVKTLLCPSDPTHSKGINTYTNWSVVSYSRNALMFDSGGGYQPSAGGYYYTLPGYTVANIPDGTSNTIGILERYAYTSSYGYASLWTHHGQDRFHWGYAQWSPTYATNWQMGNFNSSYPSGTNFAGLMSYPPQIGVKPIQAHPYYPNSGHATTNQLLMMDGSVRGVTAAVTPTTWMNAIRPDDGQALGGNW
jgi:hypothetical protein